MLRHIEVPKQGAEFICPEMLPTLSWTQFMYAGGKQGGGRWLCAQALKSDGFGFGSLPLHSRAVYPENDTFTSEGPCFH